MTQRIYTVSQLNRAVKTAIEDNILFRHIWVEGEISNFRQPASGHMYFTLKDEKSSLRCVMFRGRNVRLRFRPEDGLTVVASGSLTVYEVAGQYQLTVDELLPAGVGQLHLAFEQLKEKLAGEGLFDPERKRVLPALPQTVGIVTSPTGAALRDMVTVLRRRFPNVNIVVSPAVVQGEGGPESVVQALQRLGQRDDIDVVIVGRGGGSLEELWTFNDERVARAIANCPVPVVSAVGHETDVTIADFVADRRAPTPSAAAEMIVPEKTALVHEVQSRLLRLQGALTKNLAQRRENLRLMVQSPVLTRPGETFNQRRQQIDDLTRRAADLWRHGFQLRRERLERLVGKLESLSPLATLARGYAICRLEGTEKSVTDASRVPLNARLRVTVQKGELSCVVVDREGGHR